MSVVMVVNCCGAGQMQSFQVFGERWRDRLATSAGKSSSSGPLCCACRGCYCCCRCHCCCHLVHYVEDSLVSVLSSARLLLIQLAAPVVIHSGGGGQVVCCGAGQKQSFQAFGESCSNQQNQSVGNIVYCMVDGIQQRTVHK